MTRKMTPSYLSNCLPPLISENNPYHRRNPLERLMPHCRTEFYQQSFLPSITMIRNDLPDFVKLSSSLVVFKRFLSENDTIVPPIYYSTNRISEIIHCKLRLEISDLNSDLFKRHLTANMSCICGSPIENANHFLRDCPLFDQIRRTTINQIKNYPLIHTKHLTHGNFDLTFEENKDVFDKVQKFIILSGRFP